MAIARAAGDHDGPGLNSIAALRLEDEWAVGARAVERLDADRDHDIGAELLRLNEGAGGERLTAYACRKAKVVFDPGAGAGLTAGSAGVENRDRQALGAGVDCSRESRGPSADYGDDIDEVRPRRAGQADLTGQGRLGRIAEHRPVRTDHKRQSAGDICIAADHLFR